MEIFKALTVFKASKAAAGSFEINSSPISKKACNEAWKNIIKAGTQEENSISSNMSCHPSTKSFGEENDLINSGEVPIIRVVHQMDESITPRDTRWNNSI